jgi:cyclohexanecarboxyl-CoA dehydrogenase
MVSFAFTDEQRAFAGTLAEFCREVLSPGYRDRAASAAFPFDVLRQLGDLGVLGIGLPEKYGGTGEEDPVLLGPATETLAYGDVNMASAPIQVGLIGSQLAHAGDEVQQRYLPPLIEGRETVAIALTEPGGLRRRRIDHGGPAGSRRLAAGGGEDRDLLGLQRLRRPGVRA